MKFTDLKFVPHPVMGDNDGIHALQFFPNGYGVSVVRFPGSYGYEDGLYEVAVLKGTVDDYELCYDTDVTDDIIGHRDEIDVENIMEEVETL
jgi:hypothetical protein